MRRMLIIGELAKLLSVSTHQIRYFEEKGVLLPSKIDENGYRLYNLDAVYRLSHILLLRKLDISVSDIKKCLEHYTPDDYLKLFEQKIKEIDNQIHRLQALKKHTRQIISESDIFLKMLDQFTVVTCPERYLRCSYTLTHGASFDLHELFDSLKGELNLFETDLISIYDTSQMRICIEDENASDVALVAGDYLCYDLLLEDDYQIAGAIAQLLNHARDNHIKVSGPIVVKERSVLSMCTNQAMHYHLQILIA